MFEKEEEEDEDEEKMEQASPQNAFFICLV